MSLPENEIEVLRSRIMTLELQVNLLIGLSISLYGALIRTSWPDDKDSRAKFSNALDEISSRLDKVLEAMPGEKHGRP